MFRFSIREILLIIVICGLSVAWWRDHCDLTRRMVDGEYWRGCAGALEKVLGQHGCDVEWYRCNDEALITEHYPKGIYTRGISTSTYEPSPDKN